ncbi:MAG: hypothetical protein KGM24_14790 [Elusimicrobia bacterium]|nr:hypothetical protein [Elusimicrobiota bacterium]
MTSKFFERNKKKSLLALLLLFLRERKALSILLLLVILASGVFLSPSSLLLRMPGGARFAAGIAWIAQKAGVDVSRWGMLPPGRRSFSELEAAFQAAKEAGARGIGWGSFFGGRGGSGASGAGAAGGEVAAGSVGYVVGSQSDLQAESASGAGAAGGPSGVRGAVTDQARGADANTVTLSPGDVGGQREGFVQSAFAGGFMNGLLGGGAGAAGSQGLLSGGAYASRDFFNGGTLAPAPGNSDLAKAGLDGVQPAGVPNGRIMGAAKGKLSMARALRIDAAARQGAARAEALSGPHMAFVQLAEGRGRAVIATTPNCQPPSCPAEYAATNTGAIYDGNGVDGAGSNILTAPAIDGLTSPNVPDAGQATGMQNTAEQYSKDAQTCQALDDTSDPNSYGSQELALNQKMQNLSNQFKAADCGSGGCSQSKLDYCNGLGDQMKSACRSYQSVRCAHTKACPLTADQSCGDAADTCN